MSEASTVDIEASTYAHECYPLAIHIDHALILCEKKLSKETDQHVLVIHEEKVSVAFYNLDFSNECSDHQSLHETE